jgi:hypothetical protein
MDTIKHATCEFSSELLPFFVFQVGIVETLPSVDRRWGINKSAKATNNAWN